MGHSSHTATVGGLDFPVIKLNQEAYDLLRCEKELKIVPGATHLFEEPGALQEVARLAVEWFRRHLRPGATAAERKVERPLTLEIHSKLWR